MQPTAPIVSAPYRAPSSRAPTADFETLGRALLEDTIGTDLRIG
ncbi:MAG: hypothetical protein R3B82_00680 [Sandaracinaceae bacterium]